MYRYNNLNKMHHKTLIVSKNNVILQNKMKRNGLHVTVVAVVIVIVVITHVLIFLNYYHYLVVIVNVIVLLSK